jgi:hypothetical protein
MCDEVVIHRKDGTWLRCDDQGHLMAQMPRGLWFIDYTDCLAPGRTMFGIPDFENPLWHIEHGGYEPECCLCIVDLERTGEENGYNVDRFDEEGEFDPFDTHFREK